MNDPARILVATDVVGDADLVRKLLKEEFGNVVVSTNPDRAVADFEAQRPEVLILAFDNLEKAERYYLGVYRLSGIVHGLAHRTLILCTKDDLHRVYELCRKEYFDDYVLFWPMPHDAPRLPMAVHHAVRQLRSTSPDGPTVAEFAAQARRLAAMESLLDQYTARGHAHVEAATVSLAQTQHDIDMSADSFASKLSRGDLGDLVEVKDARGLQGEIERLRAQERVTRMRAMATAVQPVREWAGALKQEFAPQLESALALKSLAERVHPVVLVVEDDEVQSKLVRRLLADENIELAFAASGMQAMASLRRHRPDLILMDVGLPDMDGIEVTRRIKSMQLFNGVPIVMITGHSDKDVVVQSAKAGAVGFLVKPLTRDALLAKVRAWVPGTTGPAR